jgi:hypothetical protein
VEEASAHEAVDQHGGRGRRHTQVGGHVRQRRAGLPVDQAQGPKLWNRGELSATETHLGANDPHHDGDGLHHVMGQLE